MVNVVSTTPHILCSSYSTFLRHLKLDSENTPGEDAIYEFVQLSLHFMAFDFKAVLGISSCAPIVSTSHY